MRLLIVHPGANSSTADVFDGLVPALRTLGHECIEYRLDARLDLAADWFRFLWRKLGRTGEEKPQLVDILYRAGIEIVERALFFEVDGVLLISGMFVVKKIVEMLRRAGVRMAMVCTESPYDQDAEWQWVQLVDIAWTNERTSVAYLRQQSGNPHVYYLPHAYDPGRHRPGQPTREVPAHDVVFVGSAFSERIDLLSGVNWTGIDFGLYGQWQRLGSRHALRKYLRDGVIDNAYAADLYRNARIGLNLYRQSIGWWRDAPRITTAESLNPRALELAACGIFQVSDYRPEVEETFGASVPTFRTATELEVTIRSALRMEHWRHGCAEQAHTAIDRPEFTFAARAAQVSAQLQGVWAASRLAKGA